VLSDRDPKRLVSMLFVDSAFGAVIVQSLKGLGFKNVQEINFGGDSPDQHQANMRAFMWNQMKEWLMSGGMIPQRDDRLESDLGGPGFHNDKKERLVLESKADMAARNVPSPDDGDALALTFARKVAVPFQRPLEIGGQDFRGSLQRTKEFAWT
jgi:hypothetical protein